MLSLYHYLMKTRLFLIYWSTVAMILAVSLPSFGQLSVNTIDYQVTYEDLTDTYSVWVVPNYSSNNSNNPSGFEFGATAQVSLKLPTDFFISNITDVTGGWDKSPLKMGPEEQPDQFDNTTPALPAGISYYVIGKGSGETQYGTFLLGSPIKLFTFTGNGCFGAIEVLAVTDDFVTAARNELSLNTAPSFYSRSGQPSGGNQGPLEQFRAPFGPSVNCLLAVNDDYTAQAGTPSNQEVLVNDQFNNVTPATSQDVRVTIDTNPSNGSVMVNSDGTITYTANTGFVRTDTYKYTICDLQNLTVCSTATVTVMVSCPLPPAPTFVVTQPNCEVATGTFTVSTPTMGTDISYTIMGPSPSVNAVNQPSNTFAGLAPGNYTVTTTNASGCTSAPASFTVNTPQTDTPAAPRASVTAQPTCFVATGTAMVTAPVNGIGISYTLTGTSPVRPAVTNATGVFPGLTSGDYNVTTTNASGCTSLSTALVVRPQPTFPITPTANVSSQPTCAVTTGTITVTVPVNGTGISYTVTGTSPVRPAVTNTTGTFSGLAAGAYSVTTTNAAGCTSSATSLTVNVQPTFSTVPAANVSSQPTCAVTTGTITVTVPVNGTGISYTVTGTSPVRPAVTNTTGTFSGLAAGAYSVTTTNAAGCTSSAISLTVDAQPTIPVAPTITSSVTYCQEATATALTATPPNGSTLLWYTTATGGTGSTTAPTPVTTTAGTTSFYVSSVSTAGCAGSTRARIDVNVTACRAIYAFNDNNLTPINTPVSGDVLTNDDINNGTGILVVTITPVQQPGNGTVTLQSDGAYTYIPSLNFTGVDSFIYRTCDQGSPAVCATAAVYIKIIKENDPVNNNPPIARGDNYSTIPATAVAGSVLLNDKDPDAEQTLTAAKLSDPANGTVVLNSDGTFTYTPNLGFTGTDTFIYTACDTGSPTECDDATVQIEVKEDPTPGNNLPPVAIDDLDITTLNTPVSGNISDNDSEPNRTTLTVNINPILLPINGTVMLSSNGDYRYTPDNGFSGIDRVIYEICDTGTPIECARATLLIYVSDGGVALSLKAYLQGALFGVSSSDNLMRDDLRVKNLIPLASPYSALGFTALTNTIDITSAVLSVTGRDAIVDWVFVELKSATNSQQVEDSRPALIQRDGDIVDVDGVSPIIFSKVSSGDYHVMVKHRNHLSVMTQQPVTLSSTPMMVDFRLPGTLTFTKSASVVDQAQVVVKQGVAMWAGNTMYDDRVIYQGTRNDINPIYQLVIDDPANIFGKPFFKVKSYNVGDVDMNGETVFLGTGNDVEFIY